MSFSKGAVAWAKNERGTDLNKSMATGVVNGFWPGSSFRSLHSEDRS